VQTSHLKKIALIVEYDGSGYHGFQAQAHPPTVQDDLEQAIERLTGERLRVTCASRTDAGAHAKGQVVSFRTGAPYPPETFVRALNHYLPGQIAILAAHEVPMSFDVRKGATGRRYRYLILNRPVPSPLLRLRAHHVSMALDAAAMDRAAALLLGERDFAPFAGPLVPRGASTRRTLTECQVSRQEDLVNFRVAGSSFLHQQVRRTAGALVQVGLGRLSLDDFRALASRRERSAAGPALPPHGLYLDSVQYTDFPPAQGAGRTA